MPKITNVNYRNFLDKGLIDLVDYDTLKKALAKVEGINNNHVEEGRALLLALYYTGGRPVEVLDLKGEQVKKEDSFIKIEMQAAKQGLNRTIFLPYRYAGVKELYKYVVRCFPQMLLFYHYRSNRKRIINGREYVITTDNLFYYVKKWFTGIKDINPYFLRHNRFSQLSEAGATDKELQQLKGAKTVESVQPYTHLSTRAAKKIAKHIK